MDLSGGNMNQWGKIELTKEEEETLQGYYDLYKSKYPIIGKVIPG